MIKFMNIKIISHKTSVYVCFLLITLVVKIFSVRNVFPLCLLVLARSRNGGWCRRILSYNHFYYFFYPKSCLITPITLFPISVYYIVLLYMISQPSSNCFFEGFAGPSVSVCPSARNVCFGHNFSTLNHKCRYFWSEIDMFHLNIFYITFWDLSSGIHGFSYKWTWKFTFSQIMVRALLALSSSP